MKSALTLILAIYCFSLFGQDKIQEIVLDNNVKLLDYMYLPDGGLILKTGKNTFSAQSQNWILYYYNPDLSLKYKVGIEKNQHNKGFVNFLFGSKDGKYVYHCEPKGNAPTNGASSFFFTQINDKGITKTIELNYVQIPGYSIAMYADHDYLYFLNVRKDPLNKKKDKLCLFKFKHSDFTKEEVWFNLPEKKDEKFSSDYTYVGNQDGMVYLVTKSAFKEGMLIYDILGIDNNGKIIKNIEIEVKYQNSFARPGNPERYYTWCRNLQDYHDFKFSPLRSNFSGFYYTSDSYGDMYFDEKTNSFFIYAIAGPEPFLKTNMYSGYFIQKHDMSGDLIWKKDFEYSDEIMEDGFFIKGATPYMRKFKFQQISDEILKLQLASSGHIYNFIHSNKDGSQKYYFKSKGNDFFSCPDNKGSPAEKFIIKENATYKEYMIFQFKDADIILMENSGVKNSYILMTFNK
ncbi:MAG: hypothetical protein ACK40G_05335 [Cytophagaceae bacterium]